MSEHGYLTISESPEENVINGAFMCISIVLSQNKTIINKQKQQKTIKRKGKGEAF